MHSKKVALLEIYNSHDVTIYSQLLFLRAGGYDITLICSEGLRKEISDYNVGQENIYVNCEGKKGLALWKELWDIRNTLISREIDIVIFNTAHSNPIRNLCLLPFPNNMKFFGTLHGVNKLIGSVTQKLISKRVKNYFLLIDYMMEKVKKVPHEGLKFSVFYPMFHPKFPDAAIETKPPGTLWIAIPGSVEYKRRDYHTLLKNFSALKEKPNVRFLLLGNGDHAHGNGPEMRERVKKLGLENYFLFYSGFMENPVFHKYLHNSDAIMPLIHPINSDMEKYLENQISGNFPLAFGYKKPLLMHDFYKRYEDFRETSLFYNLENMDQFLKELPAILNQPIDRFNNPKWSLDYQATNYLSFIEHPNKGS